MEVINEIKKNIKESGGKDKTIQLNLSGVKIVKFSNEITSAIQECKKLQNLILSDCELVSLEGMPKLNLQGIDLTSNKLTDADLKHLKGYAKLYQLLLTDNKIQNVDSLKQLSTCKELIQLDISGNPVTETKNYRAAVFESLKSLSALDGKDIDGNQVEDQEFDDQDSGQQSEEDEEQYDDDQEDSEKPAPKKAQKKGGK